MSFSQEGTDAANNSIESIRQNPNPQVKQVKDGQFHPDNLMRSYEEYEDMIEVSAAPADDGTLVSYTALEQSHEASDRSIQQEIAEKIYSDPAYRKQLLLRVLPKFNKLDQFDQPPDDTAGKATQAASKREPGEPRLPSTGAAQLMRQINQSLGREELQKLTSIEKMEDKSRGATPNTSRSKGGTPRTDGSQQLRSFDAEFPLGD